MLFNFEGVGREDRPGPWKEENGGLAQLGEHLLCKQGVKGSIPLISTNREPRYLKEEDNRIRADSSGWLVFSGAENTFAQQM